MKLSISKPSLNILIYETFLIFLVFCITVVSGLAQPPEMIVNQKEKIIKKISELVRDKYVFRESGEKYSREILSLFNTGRYKPISIANEFADSVSQDLKNLMNDKHITFRLIESSDLGEEKEGSLHHPVRLFRLIRNENMGFFRLDWLDGNIAYMDIRRFNDPSISKTMIISAMNFVSRANALIIDVRQNQGGSTDMLPYFCGYFLKNSTRLSSTYFREDDITVETRTTNEIADECRMDVPLFILTGDKTFSAAEAFAYDMQVQGRALIVGDSTKGGRPFSGSL